jgi:hypothetical protein
MRNTKGKYLTILNNVTHRSVPFRREKGEIVIISSSTLDTEENCKVMVGNVFYEYSIDLEPRPKL